MTRKERVCARARVCIVRGGADAMMCLSDFAEKYASFAEGLGVSTHDLYQALIDTATKTVRILPVVHIVARIYHPSSYSQQIGTSVSFTSLYVLHLFI